MKNALLFFSFILFFISCSPKDIKSKLIIEKKEFSKERCLGDSCAEVFFSWPTIIDGYQKEKINKEILNKLAAYTSLDESPNKGLDLGVEAFFEEFMDFKNEFPDASAGWSIEVQAEISFDSLGILSIIFQEYNYMGGAHPNSSQTFLNFDKLTGNTLSNQEIVLEEALLLKLVEDDFRSFYEIEENVDIREDDRFFIPESGLPLAQAIGYAGENLKLIYNPYEIAPYVMGSTYIEIPLKDLEGIVKR